MRTAKVRIFVRQWLIRDQSKFLLRRVTLEQAARYDDHCGEIGL